MTLSSFHVPSGHLHVLWRNACQVLCPFFHGIVGGFDVELREFIFHTWKVCAQHKSGLMTQGRGCRGWGQHILYIAVGVSEVYQVWFRETEGSVQVCMHFFTSPFCSPWSRSSVGSESYLHQHPPGGSECWVWAGTEPEDQALAGWGGGQGGEVTVGSLPGSRCSVLPSHIAREQNHTRFLAIPPFSLIIFCHSVLWKSLSSENN